MGLMMTKITYEKFPSLQYLYLEDSYLLDIKNDNSTVILNVESVLTPGHPLYQVPKADEQYCYKEIKIIFANATDIRWIRKNLRLIPTNIDSPDYGNIDALYKKNDRYHIEGEWGSIEFNADNPIVEFSEP